MAKCAGVLTLCSMVSYVAVQPYPYHHISGICAFVHIAENMVIHVFTVDFRTFFGAICMVASPIVSNFIGISIDTRRPPSFSFTSIHR